LLYSDCTYGERKTFNLSLLTGADSARVSVLGYGSQLVEYKEGLNASAYALNSPAGLVISAVNGQHFYTDNKWPNAVVLKITGAVQKQPGPDERQADIEGAK
jgi:alpha-L-fucosidase